MTFRDKINKIENTTMNNRMTLYGKVTILKKLLGLGKLFYFCRKKLGTVKWSQWRGEESQVKIFYMVKMFCIILSKNYVYTFINI